MNRSPCPIQTGLLTSAYRPLIQADYAPARPRASSVPLLHSVPTGKSPDSAFSEALETKSRAKPPPFYSPLPVFKKVASTPNELLTQDKISNVELLSRSYNERRINDFTRPPRGGDLHTAVTALARARNVILCTGFNVAEGMPETDGPPGLAALGHALHVLGKTVTFVTDRINMPLVRAALQVLDPQVADQVTFDVMDEKDDDAIPRANQILDARQADLVLALELTGRNVDGKRLNMRGVNINEFNSAVDEVMNQANRRKLQTIGVGDGGNEAGMGGAEHVPTAMNGELMQSAIRARHQVFAWNSNLGGIAIAEILLAIGSRKDKSCTGEQLTGMISAVIALGAVDGVTRGRNLNEQVENHLGVTGKTEHTGVDGFDTTTHTVFLDMVKKITRNIPSSSERKI
ncbi:MAG: putative aspartate/glutamate/hydantoin racemase [Herminiimonas sp.]|nr:putative aspartate/glutamate/hydantoin racemase [Herminiimonas sp.]